MQKQLDLRLKSGKDPLLCKLYLSFTVIFSGNILLFFHFLLFLLFLLYFLVSCCSDVAVYILSQLLFLFYFLKKVSFELRESPEVILHDSIFIYSTIQFGTNSVFSKEAIQTTTTH